MKRGQPQGIAPTGLGSRAEKKEFEVLVVAEDAFRDFDHHTGYFSQLLGIETFRVVLGMMFWCWQ